MGFQVNFYNFSKRDNSTAIPSGTPETVSCVLKDGTSILNPTLMLEYSGIPAWSHFSMLGRYYKISDVRSIRNNIIEVDGNVDVLASWKAEILASSAFVAYDTTANTELADRRISLKTTQTTQVNKASFSTIGAGKCAVVTVVGNESTAAFAMSVTQAAYLLNDIVDWMDGVDVLPFPDISLYTSVEELLGVLVENISRIGRQFTATGKAADCIKSAIVVPFAEGAFFGDTRDVYLGQYNTGERAKRVSMTGAYITDNVTIAIPWQATDWRQNSPYHSVYVYVPYVGVIPIPASELIGETEITISAHVHVATGDAIFTLKTASKTLAQFNTNLAAPFSIGASNVSPVQSLTALGSTVGGVAAVAATGGLAAVAAGTAGILGVTNNIAALPSSIGGNAGGASLNISNECAVFTVFHDTNIEPSSVSSVIGTPANTVKSLAGLTGYVECRNASVSGAMTDAERTEINQYLNGGVYIE